MARQAGGNWQDPTALMFAIRAEAQKRLDREIAAKQKLRKELRAQNAATEAARKR